jgi:exosortase E/protease (VPEID-CTERM system)
MILVWAANVLRIALLIAIGSAGFPEVACGGFHSQAGWLAFNGVALGLVAVAGNLAWFAIEPAPPRATIRNNQTIAYLAPFLGIVATAMLTGALSAGFDWLYGLRVLVTAGLLTYFRPAYSALRWPWFRQPLALGGAACAVWLALTAGGGPTGPPNELRTVSGVWGGLWLALRMVGYVVTVPIAEELAFRGFLLRRLVSADVEQVSLSRFHWHAFAGSSVVFGLMHGRNWLPATAAGMLFALATYRRGNVAEAIVAHSATNAATFVYVLLAGDWQRLG